MRLLTLLLLLVAGRAAADDQPMRVLFVGNSYTYANDLPQIVRELALAAKGARPIETGRIAAGGATLESHWKKGVVARRLAAGRWDFVVLQEQSQRLSFAREQRTREVYQYARLLDGQIRAAKARTVLLMTWAYRDGDRRNIPRDTYGAMQLRVQLAYNELGRLLGAQVAPAGAAWRAALERRKDLALWAGDGSHPSKAGSYLAACVLFKTLTGKGPVGNPYTAGLDAATARLLQQVAASRLQ